MDLLVLVGDLHRYSDFGPGVDSAQQEGSTRDPSCGCFATSGTPAARLVITQPNLLRSY